MRLGDARTRRLYVGLLVVSVLALVLLALAEPWVLVAVLALPLAVRAAGVVRAGTTGPGLVPVLAATGLYEVAYALLVLVGVVVGRAV